MGSHREVEDKYEVGSDFVLPPLAEVPGVTAVGALEEHDLEATYVDTPDLRLTAAGITLRRRTGGTDEGWHLKLPADGARTEIREPVDGEGVPKSLRETVQVLVRDRELVPVAVVQTRRTVRNLLGPDERVLAEVADDEVASRRTADDEDQHWREVEVELVDGGPDLLEAVGTALRRAGARPAEVRSKVRRALGHHAPGTRTIPPRATSDEAATLVLARISKQLDVMLDTDPLVRQDLSGSVHAMRVATRRLRTALATYRPFLDRSVTDPIREELKWIGGVLGEARDAEVQEEALLVLLTEVEDEDEPEELARAATLDRLRVRTAFADRYRAAHARCVDALGSDRYLALVDALDQLVARPAWTDEARRPIRKVVLKRTRHEWQRVVERVPAAVDDEGLHEVRKALKRFRYAVEPLRDLYGKDARSLVKHLKSIQDVLGAHHDSITLRAELLGLAEGATERGEPSLVLGIAYAREVEEARRLAAEFEVRWPDLAKKSRRRWLG